MQDVNFDKMEGLGNDYVYITCMDGIPFDLPALARDISNRHFGVGGDGLVVITHSDKADFRMRMFNPDGSEAQMCGNASRCIARLVYEKGLTRKSEFSLETMAGVRRLYLNFRDGQLVSVSVNMGRPVLDIADIPVIPPTRIKPLPSHDIDLDGYRLRIYCVGMGNPHGVIFKDIDDGDFFNLGPRLECHAIWPEKANIEFVRILDRQNIEMRVWERGTGETLACGTGACASAVASIMLGFTDNDVNVIMRGGSLNIRLNEEGDVIMTGEAVHVASGVYYWNKK